MSPRRAITSDPEPPRTRAPRTQLTAPELEIAEGFRTAYEGASTQRRRLRVLEEYVAHYTHIAFHPDSWLVPLWIFWDDGAWVEAPVVEALVRSVGGSVPIALRRRWVEISDAPMEGALPFHPDGFFIRLV